MSFHESRFPTHISFGSVGGPERYTEIVTTANGHEERNTPWAHSRRRYDAGVGMRSLDDVSEVVAFFEARMGRLHGFRWKDWADFKSCRPSDIPRFTDEIIAIGDGSTQQFRLIRSYRSDAQFYNRPVAKPVAGTIAIGLGGVEQIDGTDWTADTTTGSITFVVAPGAGQVVTAGFEFDVPVRFDTDAIRTSVANFEAGEIPDIPLLELRT